jgi:hypothetical protein
VLDTKLRPTGIPAAAAAAAKHTVR